jgi:protocatechuate 4,5-dioxygenase alpha chain
MAGAMSGVTQEQYAEMMLKGGRQVEGNRSKAANQRKKGRK